MAKKTLIKFSYEFLQSQNMLCLNNILPLTSVPLPTTPIYTSRA